VPSQFLADAALRAGVLADRLRIVPAGLDLTRHTFRSRTPPIDRPPTVTFAGRYVAKKGVMDAARALAGVPGIRVRFVGHGPLEGALRELLAELHLDAELVDGSKPDAVRRALQATDILLTASKVADDGDAETQGLVNLEALAAGVPVVTTRSGGIPETVGDAACLVPEGDVDAMRDAVAGLVATPERWAEVGRYGRSYVERNFDLTVRAAELEQHWVDLAGRGRS
jgi:glycosyltransferase involved in cell wall biosynthesis